MENQTPLLLMRKESKTPAFIRARQIRVMQFQLNAMRGELPARDFNRLWVALALAEKHFASQPISQEDQIDFASDLPC